MRAYKAQSTCIEFAGFVATMTVTIAPSMRSYASARYGLAEGPDEADLERLKLGKDSAARQPSMGTEYAAIVLCDYQALAAGCNLAVGVEEFHLVDGIRGPAGDTRIAYDDRQALGARECNVDAVPVEDKAEAARAILTVAGT